MSEMSRLYLELQEQAEFYGCDLDFETLEFIPKKELGKIKWKHESWYDQDNAPNSPLEQDLDDER